ncbi:MAG: radical SAM protein [Candidatus Cloacimonetes bacterium]|nr:radical SAM protein [Candidatus Cloacimonadota bacterium]MBT4576505.1 radical SAM protein [Candidatus Cloacimonadota bacterium]
MLKISEIFCSIQGESTYSGLPCIFIRLAGCNLRCDYCDSTYSYESDIEFSVADIISKIRGYNPLKLVEITGGEPLLQSEVYQLFELLHQDGFTILIESNGSISLRDVPEHIIKIVDVKCPGSGEEESFLLENLEFIHKEKDEIKFVLSDNFDYNWAKDFITKYKLNDYEILFSAVSDRLDQQDLAQWIVEDGLSVRMQLQLHKVIWDKDKRGV